MSCLTYTKLTLNKGRKQMFIEKLTDEEIVKLARECYKESFPVEMDVTTHAESVIGFDDIRRSKRERAVGVYFYSNEQEAKRLGSSIKDYILFGDFNLISNVLNDVTTNGIYMHYASEMYNKFGDEWLDAYYQATVSEIELMKSMRLNSMEARIDYKVAENIEREYDTRFKHTKIRFERLKRELISRKAQSEGAEEK